MMTKPRLAMSILNWNGLKLTQACLRKVLASSFLPEKIIVLDNGSNQNEASSLRQEFSTAPVTVLRSEINLGFAGGNNYVIQQLLQTGQYDYILLLNQDALVEPQCLERLVRYLETNPTVAVAGPLVLNYDDTIQSCGASLNRWTGKVISQLQGKAHAAAPTAPVLVDCVVGNCFMMRRSALERIGWLDEDFFAYYEEVDWCMRAHQAGLTCAIVPQATIQHSKSGGFRTYLIVRNMIWFQKRQASTIQVFCFFWYFWGYFLFERLKKGSPINELWRAARDGWLNRNIGKP